MRIVKLFAAAAVTAAAVLVPAAAAQAAPCQGIYSIANYAGKVEVTGGFACDNGWQPAYLVLLRSQNGGSPQYVASGMGVATYVCRTSDIWTYQLGGQVVGSGGYTLTDVHCG
ncbi:hypothetical protein AB0J90_24190 [Micromonospora sp. NPDC049523]|uniref:hypothetical protein n=1 Tax=unclassified Micromonospora TaxID=2617518 RepID=UPI002DD7B7A2|nr:hypothetical protein [Micromonospora sp. NBC_01796]WSA84334.1 hypothetical protein OIE47_28830 [Micromonospora sp. NBC_01796]